MLIKELLQLNEAKKPDYQDVDDFAVNYSHKIGSAFDIWTRDEDKEKMFELYKKGHRFIAKTFEFGDDYDKTLTKIDKWSNTQKAKGYLIYSKEENGDVRDVLLMSKTPVKPAQL